MRRVYELIAYIARGVRPNQSLTPLTMFELTRLNTLGLVATVDQLRTEGGCTMGDDVRERAQLYAGVHLVRRRLQERALTQLSAVLASRGQRAVLLKGSASCLQLAYPALRSRGDIDLLVGRDAMALVSGILVDLGYCQRSRLSPAFYDGHHHAMPFRHPQTGVVIELHRRLLPDADPLSTLPELQPREVLERATPAGAGLGVPDGETLRWHVLAHLFGDPEPAGLVRGLIDLAAIGLPLRLPDGLAPVQRQAVLLRCAVAARLLAEILSGEAPEARGAMRSTRAAWLTAIARGQLTVMARSPQWRQRSILSWRALLRPEPTVVAVGRALGWQLFPPAPPQYSWAAFQAARLTRARKRLCSVLSEAIEIKASSSR